MHKALLTLLLCYSCAVQTQELPITIGQNAFDSMPQLSERVIKALTEEGLSPSLYVTSGDRALHLLLKGQMAIDIFRHPKVMEDYDMVHQIEPAVMSIHMKRVVSSQSPDYCLANDASLRVIAVEGIPAYKKVIAPQFANLTWVPSEVNALKMVAAGRGEITYWLEGHLNMIEEQGLQEELIICDQHSVNLEIFSYLHNNYLHLKPQIEALYQHLFLQE